MTTMRAKLRVSSVQAYQTDGTTTSEKVNFNAVAASNYPEDGTDENNTYAKFSPYAAFEISIANPALFGKFERDQEYYVDFTLAEKEQAAEAA